MSTAPADILRYLGNCDHPIDVQVLARALDTADIKGLSYMLGNLVRSHQVERHHKGDGILRYSLRRDGQAANTGPASAPASGKGATARAVAPQVDQPTSMASAVREFIKQAGRPVTADQLIAAHPDRKPETVRAAIYEGVREKRLTSRYIPGTHVKEYALADATVPMATLLPPRAADFPCHTAPVVAEGKEQGVAPCDAPAVDAIDHAVKMAEAALQAYIESKVEPSVYSQLVESAKAARAARDQFQARHNA